MRAQNAKLDVDFSAEAEHEPPTTGDVEKKPPPAIAGPLTLDDAIAYAVAYNLDAAVSREEQRVQREMATASMLRMLPSLIANMERSWKSRNVPSSSKSFQTGQESLEPSISSDLLTSTESIELSWDLLDLAINVNRWRQAEDRVRLRELQLKRVKQDLALDVTAAYLRAAVAKASIDRAGTVVGYARQRQDILDDQMAKGLIPRIDGLQGSIDIHELLIRMTKYTDDYKAARTELARLLGLNPNTPFELADVDFSTVPGHLAVTGEELANQAVLHRPELFELDIEEGITAKDAEIAIMEMFPSVTPFTRYQHDANSYLSRHHWLVSGLKLSWDLLSIPESWAQERTAQGRCKLVRKRRMNMAMAVLTQLQLSVIEYDNYLRQVEQTTGLEKLRKDLAIEVHQQVETGRLKESTLLSADQSYVVAYRARLTAYARLVTARQRILNSLGRDWNDQGEELSAGVKELEVSLK